MKPIAYMLAAVAMSGCASVAELRAKPPEQTFQGAAGVDKTSECILFAWQNQSLAGVHYDAFLQPRPGGGKTVVSQGQVEFADLVASGSGSEIKLYVQPGTLSWRIDRRAEAIKSCL